MPCPISLLASVAGRGGRAGARSAQLTLGQALALGALHGPTELLPVSSSAHTVVVPWLLGWPYTDLDRALRKSFEVALHAGTAAAWLMCPPTHGGTVDGRRPRPGGRVARPGVLLAALGPPAAAGLLFEHAIQRHLGTPHTIAAGLLFGAAAMVAADRAPQRRDVQEASARDGLWLGLAQACALVPGVSRAGATLATARLRGFTTRASWQLSTQTGLPVIVGAAGLKSLSTLRRGRSHGEAAILGAGAAASFMSALVVAGLSSRVRASERLLPYAVYRTALAGVVVAHAATGHSTAHRCRSARR